MNRLPCWLRFNRLLGTFFTRRRNLSFDFRSGVFLLGRIKNVYWFSSPDEDLIGLNLSKNVESFKRMANMC